ncbi:MAG TPA: carbohydrate ABC transporter permease [Mesotoga sp.]|jgi:ABC-type glycerol-3-phosphate transport system permease component|uniref:carbohydrate ABC transporter permease n=1 Tax=Mesotoga sp. H07pep.5.4 TaxID=1463664 RepID=UPI00074A6FF8|nr:carbohydrate ABC transporter permease [Mesotoga sp. H07pep.5.4]KUK94341.1 MAG: Binding-protein-dependent transport systems inner membrane component [Thermotogales bacterium 46_20]MDD4041776.1 carbohydrate ABC transporter permease [Mesotoga sp.]NLX34954.1 carbohydrate ABC transporter permease [Thermotogaceae bacterium]MDD4478785.1 carbohydrate ABC transporter permease [Mesotoga sp.]MDD5744564.1 carbohydrate ABC transporter permease [Mesotoga sp.]
MNKKGKKLIGWSLRYMILIGVSLFTLMPLLWAFSTSITPDTGIVTYKIIPKSVTLDNYPAAWDYPRLFDENVTLGTMFLNSILVAGAITLASLLFDSMAGYALARKQFFGKTLLFWAALSTLMIPFYVIVIPLYLIILRMGLINSYTSMIIPFMSSGFGVFMFRQTFFSIPLELEEAARMDGAKDFYIYWKVMLPLVKPTIATMAIMKVLWSWNMFFWPLLVVQDYSKMPINLGLTVFRGHNITRWGLMSAGMIIATIPVLILFLSLQKWYIQGLTSGAVKG